MARLLPRQGQPPVVARSNASGLHGRFAHMTRENKLALVIGFALILFVGVLVSDHFSAARSQKEADLSLDGGTIITASQPAVRIIDLNQQSREAAATAKSAAVESAAVTEPSTAQESLPGFVDANEVRAPDLQALADAGTSGSSGGAPGGAVVHSVAAGETLMAISRRYFGDAAHVRALVEFNKMSDANVLRPGDRIRIPVTQQVAVADVPPGFEPVNETPDGAGPTEIPPGFVSAAEARSASATYTIKSTDTLSEISLRLLGTSRRWREIVALNPDVITDPDQIPAGAVIKVPSSKRPVRVAAERH